ncbi:Very short patch repair protein [Pseudobythopirellula maris]|uniref:Very short patch repair protein n=2 Tax=Pseudobythopirellula maris TaxID=2527991 RepID=A0A5C5ZRX8_9BACT|nr:Very short patch repair protein [Pseudobythopirellula maris]
MAAVKSRDTGPELAMAAALRAAKVRFRRDVKSLPGRPDFVIPAARLVVFVHGCWWHAHPCPRGDRPAKTNAAYWEAKIDRNRRRDRRVARELRALGYSVWTVWECQLRKHGVPLRLIRAIERRSD